MTDDDQRRNMALFSMGIVMKLTDLTARQIRYYEQQGLVNPARTVGNQRTFSFNDVERLLEIKKWIEKGINIAGIKQMINPTAHTAEQQSDEAIALISLSETTLPEKLSRKQMHQLLKQELLEQRHGSKASMIQGQLSRFFKK
ncbi:MerR family transcriptional regulator [Paenibacillus yanchengensis]|uniref:MerR family transcriptional regulator n=1 Tax=Paenibacillus yanchengensis TaxID=2035833 RepID=A0ABW4YJP5_9BACL